MDKIKYNFTILCWSEDTDVTSYINTHTRRSHFICFHSCFMSSSIMSKTEYGEKVKYECIPLEH